MAEFWATVAQQMAGGSRTDVLRALVWPIAMILLGLIWLSTHAALVLLQIILGGFLVIFLVLYVVAYIFFGWKDPNLLRSEKYNIEKLAIEHGIIGDSLKGIINNKIEPKMITESITIEKT